MSSEKTNVEGQDDNADREKISINFGRPTMGWITWPLALVVAAWLLSNATINVRLEGALAQSINQVSAQNPVQVGAEKTAQ